MAKNLLPFEYEVDPSNSGQTALAGLPAYLDLAAVCGLTNSIRQHLTVNSNKQQGWTDEQIIMALVLLNLTGGESVEDLRILEGDEGFAKVMRRVETHGLPRSERRALEKRWRQERRRAVPSPSPVFRYLSAFHNPDEESNRQPGKAFIPTPNQHLQSLQQVNMDMLAFVQKKNPEKTATLDMDATLIETQKRQSLFSYKGYKAYQPLNIYWFEQKTIVHSEFRDGNVPAGYEQLRVFQQGLNSIPPGVEKVFLRSDTAGYQHELLQYCAEGKNERFGVIEFAIGVDVTPAFKEAVATVEETEWQPLQQQIAPGYQIKTGQEWAEVCFAPNGLSKKKNGPDYRFIAIREPLSRSELFDSDLEQLPFPTLELKSSGRYKLFGLVTNRTLPGQELIDWHRQRCGESEKAHAIMKDDLAGGRLPSGDFGENAAWWLIMLLAFNLSALMTQLVLPKTWAGKRLKAIRFGLIHLAGRVIERSRQLIVRLSGNHPSTELLFDVRHRILQLALVPSG